MNGNLMVLRKDLKEAFATIDKVCKSGDKFLIEQMLFEWDKKTLGIAENHVEELKKIITSLTEKLANEKDDKKKLSIEKDILQKKDKLLQAEKEFVKAKEQVKQQEEADAKKA